MPTEACRSVFLPQTGRLPVRQRRTPVRAYPRAVLPLNNNFPKRETKNKYSYSLCFDEIDNDETLG